MRTILRCILIAVILYWPCSATCSYNFSAGYDVVFLLDQRWNITDEETANVDNCIRLLIHYRMLIGPENDHSRLAFVQFYHDTYSASGPNYIAEPRPVYESEFFAPMGAFDVSRKRQSIDEDSEKPGLEEAISAISSVFLENEPTTRPKALFVVSDFQFEDPDEQAAITNALSELLYNVTSIGGSLELYGIGYGSGLNATSMEAILKDVNGSDEDCGMNTTEWLEYLDDVGRIAAKGNDTYGTRRPFNDTSLCCYLCYIQLNVSLPSCSLEEFFHFTEDDLKVPGLVPLNCTAEGIQDQCVAGNASDVIEPGDNWTWQTTEETVSIPDSTTSISTEYNNESSLTGGSFSGLLIALVLCNLCLSIMFLLVCIYVKKIVAPQHQKGLSIESIIRKTKSENKYATPPDRKSTKRKNEPSTAVMSSPNTTVSNQTEDVRDHADLYENSFVQVDEKEQGTVNTNTHSYENVTSWTTLVPERAEAASAENGRMASSGRRSTNSRRESRHDWNTVERSTMSTNTAVLQVAGASSTLKIEGGPKQSTNANSYENVTTWLTPGQNGEQEEPKRDEGVYENIPDIAQSGHSNQESESQRGGEVYENIVMRP